MSRSILALLLLLASVVYLAAAWRGQERQPRIQLLMTDEQVLDILGKPDHVTRQVYAQGTIQQWIYEKRKLRLDLENKFGDIPKVQRIDPDR